MSPLARIPQVACTLLLCYTGITLADGTAATQRAAPVGPSLGGQVATAPQSALVAQSVSPAQSVSRVQSALPAPSTSPARPMEGIALAQPASPVRLTRDAAAQITHSALLAVEGTAAADALQLRIRRVGDKSLVSSDDVTVTVDGKNESVTRESAGVYALPVNDLRGGNRDVSHDVGHDLDVIVGHDGIREILSGKVTLVEAGSGNSLLGDHRQIGWWVLNITIVLIAAIAFSRRKG